MDELANPLSRNHREVDSWKSTLGNRLLDAFRSPIHRRLTLSSSIALRYGLSTVAQSLSPFGEANHSQLHNIMDNTSDDRLTFVRDDMTVLFASANGVSSILGNSVCNRVGNHSSHNTGKLRWPPSVPGRTRKRPSIYTITIVQAVGIVAVTGRD
jgi:hypothetical protein